MASKISFPEGWFNTYPQTQPSVDPPSRPKKVKKGVHATNKTEQPQTNLLQPVYNLLLQVWLGLLSLTMSMSRDESNKNPKVSKQKQKEQANKQANKNTVGCPTGTTPKEKCTICKGPHSNLMFCPKLTQYLPFGRYQPPPVWLCLQCLSTKHWNAKNCNHMGNRFYKNSLCPITKKHYLLCTRCEHHFPGIRYMNYHHDPSLGFKNFGLMRQCLGIEMFTSLIPNYSAYKGYC